MLQLTAANVSVGKQAVDKHQAIKEIAADLVSKGFVTTGYENGMLEREGQNSTYLGNGIAIPHGTTGTRDLVEQTGVQVHHFAEGVDWGDGNTAYLVIGIAAKSDEHLGILKQLTGVLSADGVEDKLKNIKTPEEVIALLNGEADDIKTGLVFVPELVSLSFPVEDMLSLIAVAAGKLKNLGAIGDTTIKAFINSNATHLGKGLWIASTDQAVSQTALSFITPENSFEYQGNEVCALLLVAANSADYIQVLSNLSTLIATNKVADLYHCDAEDIIKSLTEIRQAGITQVFTIKNPHGLHARPGATLVNVVKRFESKIVVSNLSGDGKQANAKSLMKVIALGVKQGHQLEFVADGVDAEQALEAIGQAIADGLGEG